MKKVARDGGGGGGGGGRDSEIAEMRMKPLKPFKTQQSTVQSRRQNAVCVRRAYKMYGSASDNPNVILDGLNMTVPKGTIYGLLGASGCGKTTLLSCIVGRRRLNSGEIWVLGGTPGGRGSGVPGPRIGYMPQELALYGEFSVKETLYYFGWLCGFSSRVVETRLEFLLDLLQLPFPERMIKNLSGGQQRRVSFAAAMIHDPELLILDEPTVGLDPLLRQNIWNYLVEITRDRRKTIIITTHYIDETRQANLIGLMRGGRFLAEESPKSLLDRYQCPSLEDVFLKLSILQNRGKRRRSSAVQSITESIQIPAGQINEGAIFVDDEIGEISGEFGDNISMSSGRAGHIRVSITPDATFPVPSTSTASVIKSPGGFASSDMPISLSDLNANHYGDDNNNYGTDGTDDNDDDTNNHNETKSFWDCCVLFRMYHMKALMWKNMLWMWRNFGVLCFVIFLPVIQMVLFCLTIGRDPQFLSLAVTNYESLVARNNSGSSIGLNECNYSRKCDITVLNTTDAATTSIAATTMQLGCGYLEHLRRRNNLQLHMFETEADAKRAVSDGRAWAALTIRRNYSHALVHRFLNGYSTEPWDVQASLVSIWQDMSDQQISTLLYRDFNFAFLDFVHEVLSDCKLNPLIAKLPLRFNDAIYGLNEPNFTDFAAPGIILTIIFFMAVALTSGAMLRERNEGILERTLVVGISATEILFAFVGTEFVITLLHTAFVLGVGFVVFHLTITGEMLWIALLCIMTGMCGMCFGFLVSIACDNERTATYAAMGCFLPIVMLCGIIWPIEGMNYFLRKLAYFLPLTLSTESVRSILQRGWSIDVGHVQNGFVATFLWICVFLVLSILLMKFKKG